MHCSSTESWQNCIVSHSTKHYLTNGKVSLRVVYSKCSLKTITRFNHLGMGSVPLPPFHIGCH